MRDIDDAQRETTAILAANPSRSASDPTLPLFRLFASHRLESERERFEAGDRMALLGAIRICANHDLPMPSWVSKAYITAYDSVLSCRVKSWDVAFGKPYPGKHLASLKARRELRFAVLDAIKKRLVDDPKSAIDVGLFEEVGKLFDIGHTLCSDLYYSAAEMFSQSGQEKPTSAK